MNHLRGQGCPKCKFEKQILRQSSNIKDFIEKAKIIHNNLYDYSQSLYINNRTKIKIICPKHSEFFQIPRNHLLGRGCPKCARSASKGERQVSNYIQKVYKGNISLNDRKTIINPITNRFLELDIYIPDKNIAIEYNGSYWHSSDYSVIKDNYKKEFCRKNGIYLMTIDDESWRTDKNYKQIIKITLKNLLK